MKALLFQLSILSLFISCNNKSIENNKPVTTERFIIEGKIEESNNQIIYLYTVQKNKPILKDSTRIKKNRFHFSGVIKHPVKALVQIKQKNIGTPFILANERINIDLSAHENPLISSPINDDFEILKKQSISIYKQIDCLFPQLQKARMENDHKTLTEIHEKIELIELEGNKYFIDYIRKNPEKQLSALLLNDLWNVHKNDSVQLQILAGKLNPNIQQTLNFSIH